MGVCIPIQATHGCLESQILRLYKLLDQSPTHEGLPNREGAKPGEIGDGHSGGLRGNARWGNAGVTPPGLVDGSEGSGH